DVTFFVDGESIGTISAPMTGVPLAFDTNTNPLAFGDNPRYEHIPDAEYFEGTFDEIAIYPRALTASDLRTDYLLGVNGPTAPSITSPSSVGLVAGLPAMFQVTATGTPAPALSETGTLPDGLMFDSAGNLMGIPTPGTAGVYHVTVT